MPLPKHEIAAIVEQFYFSEADGAKLIHELPAFAPGKHEKEFCQHWEADEAKHETLFANIIDEYNIKQQKANPLFAGLFGIAWECVEEKDWTKCITIAAIIEHIALEAGMYIQEQGDDPVKKVIEQILPDEKKHLAFSQQQLQKYAQTEKEKIQEVLKKVKHLSFQLGKQHKFTKHDIIVANRAEKKFLAALRTMGIQYPHIVNKNGWVRNSIYAFVVR